MAIKAKVITHRDIDRLFLTAYFSGVGDQAIHVEADGWDMETLTELEDFESISDVSFTDDGDHVVIRLSGSHNPEDESACAEIIARSLCIIPQELAIEPCPNCGGGESSPRLVVISMNGITSNSTGLSRN